MAKERIILSSLLALGLLGCSTYQHPESIADKMSRFSPRDVNPNKVPKIMIPESSASRGIASVETQEAPEENTYDTESMESETDGLTYKRLYFMGLYQQYRTLGAYIQKEQVPEIQHCPSFHTTLLNGKTYSSVDPQQMKKKKIDFNERFQSIDEAKAAYYPELFLPMEVDDHSTTLADVIKESPELDKNVAFEQALKVHLTKTYKELEELCDSGHSSNYYNYENLTRHIKSYRSHYQAGGQPFKTLVKTTIFSNMALIESLELGQPTQSRSRMPASVGGRDNSPSANQYQDKMLKDLNLSWSKKYLIQNLDRR